MTTAQDYPELRERVRWLYRTARTGTPTNIAAYKLLQYGVWGYGMAHEAWSLCWQNRRVLRAVQLSIEGIPQPELPGVEKPAPPPEMRPGDVVVRGDGVGDWVSIETNGRRLHVREHVRPAAPAVGTLDDLYGSDDLREWKRPEQAQEAGDD